MATYNYGKGNDIINIVNDEDGALGLAGSTLTDAGGNNRLTITLNHHVKNDIHRYDFRDLVPCSKNLARALLS
jgi:hypothetical protein